MNDFFYPQIESGLQRNSRALEQYRIRNSEFKEEYDALKRLDAPNLVERETPVGAAEIINAIAEFNQRVLDKQDITNKILDTGFVKEGRLGELVELFDK